MTYWPISSPSVYAASKQTRTPPAAVSPDGTDEAASEKAIVADKAGTREVHAEEDITGEIVALKVTRSGHLFATITRSTLTIWQTKARRP